MKNLKAVIAGAAVLVLLAANSAWAVATQPGGPNSSTVTIGNPVTDGNDVQIDRCECDGGPLEAITVHTDRADAVVRIDRLVGQIARTSDGIRVGNIVHATNTEHDAIVLVIQLDDGLIGTVQRIAVRRTAFYYSDGVVIIDTTMADLQQSVLAGAAGAGA